jgi:Leucine-rich repeat (LRR) protein
MCIELAHCDLQTLPAEFSQLSCLQRLNLQNNMLSAVDDCIFQLTTLVNLDVSGNLLRSITGLFSALSEMVACDISNNKITSGSEILKRIPGLQKVFLSLNDFESDPAKFAGILNARGDAKRIKTSPSLGALSVLPEISYR